MEVEDQNDISLRPMFVEINALTRADGSAMFTQGETAVMASMYGPVEGRLQHLQIEKAYVDVYYRSKAGLSTVANRLKERIIRNTCESALLTALYPRTAITIQLQEMEDRGGLIACAINAACLSLINGGISMRYTVAAVNCIVDAEGQTILDPDHRKCADSKAQLTFVFDSVERNIVSIHTTGKYTIGQYNDAMTMCREASQLVFQLYKDSVKKFAKLI